MKDLNKRLYIRLYFTALLLMVPFVAILYKLVVLQWVEGPALKASVEQQIIRYHTIAPVRGNIYSSDQKLLATSMPLFDIYFDPLAVSKSVWSSEIDGLAAKLASYDKSKSEWLRLLNSYRNSGNRYVKLLDNVSFSDVQQIKTFPVFRYGKFKGGLIIEQQSVRKMPMSGVAERTIGYSNSDRGQTGLEGAYDFWLKGKEGKRWMQLMAKGHWKPINNGWDEDPENGYDVVSTIDSRMQDILHHELLSALRQYEADHGTAVLMEVHTGKIRAMVNLGQTDHGTYSEILNYAVWESSEPGSTFKLLTTLVLLEDKKADTSTTVDIGNGSYTFYDRVVTEANFSEKGSADKYGVISLAKAFEQSSNVAFAKLVFDNYKDNPSRFVDKLYKIGIHKPLNFEIKGETPPKIPHPDDRTQWSGITLPWMAFGYQTSFTPLQLLAVYNAVANGGVMVKPFIVEEIRKNKKVVRKFEKSVLNPSICSQSTLDKVQVLLANVVKQGTARHLYDPNVRLAGKTGTAKLDYWKEKSSRKYRASFAGYFPSDAPRYSIIVVIDKPNPDKAYYGSRVAAPVAARTAQAVMSLTPGERSIAFSDVVRPDQWESAVHQKQEFIRKKLAAHTMPDLIGMPVSLAISALENEGYRVSALGAGRIAWQYPQPNTLISKSMMIELKSYNQ
ncbi:MAG: penicillin-binding transpeptidase domain-containing protein [Thermaurantimonas sp.]